VGGFYQSPSNSRYPRLQILTVRNSWTTCVLTCHPCAKPVSRSGVPWRQNGDRDEAAVHLWWHRGNRERRRHGGPGRRRGI